MRPIHLAVPLAALVAAAACLPQRVPSGGEDYATFCAACHGPAGRGDGPAAAGLPARPADLTGLSRRNGGDFPRLRVMGKIWGYTGGRDGAAVMPHFGPLLDSPLVPHDAGDGIASPTPVRLVQLADYLEALQR